MLFTKKEKSGHNNDLYQLSVLLFAEVTLRNTFIFFCHAFLCIYFSHSLRVDTFMLHLYGFSPSPSHYWIISAFIQLHSASAARTVLNQVVKQWDLPCDYHPKMNTTSRHLCDYISVPSACPDRFHYNNREDNWIRDLIKDFRYWNVQK